MSELDVEIWMERPDLEGIPVASLPRGYRFRPYRTGDAAVWDRIQTEADKWFSPDNDAFDKVFTSDEDTRARRILFVEDEDGDPVGTAAAWYANDAPSGPEGQFHWFAVLPAHQRKGIGRALLARTLEVMAGMHRSAMLETSGARPDALKLYLDFGFVPRIVGERDRAAWRELARILGHPRLKGGSF